MKETKIAEENIENWKYFKKAKVESEEESDYESRGNEHKASCQRFLEFLSSIKVNNVDSISFEVMFNKITDLKNAIKKYEEAGI